MVGLPAEGVPRVSDLAFIDLVIFDCDGVLIDSEPIASRTMAAAMRAAGADITAEEAHLRFTGNAMATIRRMFAEDYGFSDIDGIIDGWSAELYREFEVSLAAMAGIEEVVAGLGRPVCVASNSNLDRLRRSLGLLPLWSRFDPHVFSAEMVALPKPAPELLLLAAERFAARPERTVMIDDSPHGIEAARAAGMPGIGFVDPADPRPGRRARLLEAGAEAVAEGAAALRPLIEAVNARLAASSAVA
jgi:HAD superfamily hydrolase (TIGR01509 family)